MTTVRVPYGKTELQATVPDDCEVQVIAPRTTAAAANPLGRAAAALANTAGNVRLADFAGATTAAIAINDKTRPVDHAALLPPLLAELHALGMKEQDITLVIASGTHVPMTPAEYEEILPAEIIARYPIVSHDALHGDELQYLGDTSRGTPVYINAVYMRADLHLAIGNVEPHQFMGFSGGVKSVAIGLAGKETINHNHAMMTNPDASLGIYHANPMRADVEEIGALLRVDFVLNALINNQKQVVDVLAGAPVAVMEAAIPRVRALNEVMVDAAFDIVITSPGGHPKDCNLYQGQKALGHASRIVKDEGAVILTAACPDGTGSRAYEEWILAPGMTSHAAVFERFAQEGFRVGPHKAYQISRDASRAHVTLISEMEPEFVQRLLLHTAENLQSALDAVVFPGARVGVMPAANATIPVLKAAD
ncbi:MAG: nickel-dependent lactate racemase [Anaerolineales bacterium]